MAKIIGEPFDDRLIKHADACILQAAKKAPKGYKLSRTKEGYPQISFRAKGETAYYKVFDTFETCLGKKRPKGKKPCIGLKGQKLKVCRDKQHKFRVDELNKLKKKKFGKGR
jgi:hypothetical protein